MGTNKSYRVNSKSDPSLIEPLIDYVREKAIIASENPDVESIIESFTNDYFEHPSVIRKIKQSLFTDEECNLVGMKLLDNGYDPDRDILVPLLEDKSLYYVKTENGPSEDFLVNVVVEDSGDFRLNNLEDKEFFDIARLIISTDDLAKLMLMELRKDGIRLGRYSQFDLSNINSSRPSASFAFNYPTEVKFYVYLDRGKLESAFLEKARSLGISDDKSENIVYRFCGTNDCVGGASAKNMYVVMLKPNQLRDEGNALGTCIGSSKSFGNAIRKGDSSIFSIRTETGRPKLDIDITMSGKTFSKVSQIKGKANRLPGYIAVPKGSSVDKLQMTKPDEVRLVVEFLMYLGFTPEEIRESKDIRSGVQAMIESGVDPFSPPVVGLRKLKGHRQNSSLSARMAMIDYSKPWGGVWGERA